MQTVPGLQVFNQESSLHAQFSPAAGSLTRTFLRARSALFHRICALLLLHHEVSQVRYAVARFESDGIKSERAKINLAAPKPILCFPSISSRRKKSVALKLLLDRHSPSHVRVNTAVANLPQFAESFRCPKEAKLNLNAEERCALW